jgi:hypothetical protein
MAKIGAFVGANSAVLRVCGTRRPATGASFADPCAPRKPMCARPYFLTLSASAASSAVGISPPAFWARLMSESLLPTKTSSIRP